MDNGGTLTLSLRSIINHLLMVVMSRPALSRFNEYLRTIANRGLGIGHYGPLVSKAEKRFLDKVLAEDIVDAIFDVGGNEGWFATHARRLAPRARLLAFEPHPNTYKRLLEIGQVENFEVYNLALGDHPGQAQLYDHAGADGTGQASMHAAVDLGRFARLDAFNVEVDTVDAVAQRENITRIFLLKVDVEGHGLAVLHGAHQMLSTGAIEIVMFEFETLNLNSGATLKDFYRLLDGYSFYRLLPNSLLPLGEYDTKNEVFIYQNIVAFSAQYDGRAKPQLGKRA